MFVSEYNVALSVGEATAVLSLIIRLSLQWSGLSLGRRAEKDKKQKAQPCCPSLARPLSLILLFNHIAFSSINTKEKQVSHLCKYKKMQYCSQAHTPANLQRFGLRASLTPVGR